MLLLLRLLELLLKLLPLLQLLLELLRRAVLPRLHAEGPMLHRIARIVQLIRLFGLVRRFRSFLVSVLPGLRIAPGVR